MAFLGDPNYYIKPGFAQCSTEELKQWIDNLKLVAERSSYSLPNVPCTGYKENDTPETLSGSYNAWLAIQEEEKRCLSKKQLNVWNVGKIFSKFR